MSAAVGAVLGVGGVLGADVTVLAIEPGGRTPVEEIGRVRAAALGLVAGAFLSFKA